MTPTETAAILRQFNAWRRDFDDKIRQPDPREIGEAIDAAVEMIDRLELAESSVAWHRRRWMALQMHQTKMREPERTMICDILANGELMRPTVAGDRYALPGAQPAPSLASNDVSLISEGKTQPAQSVKDVIIDDLQSQFDTEGITEHDSGDALIRLSDAIAAVEDNFAQPAPSVPDTYAAGINAVAAMLQSKADEYAKEHGHDDMGGLSFGPGMGGQIKMDYYTNLIELTDDVRAMIAAAPEAKP